MPPFTPPPLSANSGDQLWLDCVEQLAQELPEQQFNTWIRPLAARVSEDQTKVTVLVGNRFKLDWVRTQYAHRLAAILQQIQGHPITLELSLTPREIPVKSSSFRPMPEPELVMETGIEAEAPAGAGFRTRLNSALTFDSLVEGGWARGEMMEMYILYFDGFDDPFCVCNHHLMDQLLVIIV